MTHPLPTIGTRYIRLSDEALCLDSASVARIQVSCIERPERPQHRPPKAIKTTVPAKVSRYARTVAASTARHARALADWDAYVNAPIVEALYHVLGEPAQVPLDVVGIGQQDPRPQGRVAAGDPGGVPHPRPGGTAPRADPGRLRSRPTR